MLVGWMKNDTSINQRLPPSEDLLELLLLPMLVSSSEYFITFLLDATVIRLGDPLLVLTATLLLLASFAISKIAADSLVLAPVVDWYLENASLYTCNFAFSLAKNSFRSIK